MNQPAGGHTLKKYDEELSTLRDLVLRMGGMVEDQLRDAMAALASADVAAARDVAARDRGIDRIELQADQEIAQLLARRTPLGGDLRTVLMLAKSVTDLERIGDEAKKVARCCERTGATLAVCPPDVMGAIADTARLAAEQLRGALDALARRDLALADAIKDADKQIDDAFRAARDRIAEWLMQRPDLAHGAIELLFAAKALERIGDHAKNITQYVFYLVEGRDVRHPKAGWVG